MNWIEGLTEQKRERQRKSARDRERAKQESERKRSEKREICMSQEQFLGNSLRRFGEGLSMFFVVLCGDLVRELFARSVVVEMK